MASEPSEHRLRAIAAKHKPRGWKVEEWNKKDNGNGFDSVAEADWETKTIKCLPITNRKNLAYFLHECGHVNLGHAHDDERTAAAWEIEYEAEMYAFRALRAEGISVPRRVIKSAKSYIRKCIEDVYARAGDKDKLYHDNGMEVADHILRFVYGKEWRKHR